MTTDSIAAKIAVEFRRLIRKVLTEEELEEVDEKNARPEYEAEDATHDYCDANVYMAEAFKTVVGREPFEADVDADLETVNAAWNLAREKPFSKE